MAAIFKLLLPMLLKLFIQFGMAWLAKKFPWLNDEQKQVLQDLHDETKASKRKACEGIACAMDTKGLG